MNADLIRDFDYFLDHDMVWNVIVELPFSDEETDGVITVSNYVVAPNDDLAQYMATVMYPDCSSVSVYNEPTTREEYVGRRQICRV